MAVSYTHLDSYGRQQWGILHNGGNPDAATPREGRSISAVSYTHLEETVFDFSTLKHRFREIAFLTKGLKIVAEDKSCLLYTSRCV